VGRIYHVVTCLLIVVIAICCWAQVASTGPPLTGSQVITLEAGPDGVWLGHASVFALQLRSDTHIDIVYDTWRLDGVTAYRQWDLSISREWLPIRWLPMSATIGTRWRPPLDTVKSYGGTGPWVYGILQLGF
jgi:hypothetical protein